MKKMTIKQIILALTLGTLIAGQVAVAAEEQLTEQQLKEQAKRIKQRTFATVEDAAAALYEAIKTHQLKAIYAVLGPGSGKLIYTGDPVADQQAHERFMTAYNQSVNFEFDGDAKATLLLGDNDWPMPYPLVKEDKGWRFDAKAGAEEIINRRIGANELAAITTCLAIGDAQQEYAEADRDGDGLLEYAQKFQSTEGKQDGLYWKTKPGEALPPLGPLLARAKQAGYTAKKDRSVPYQGYYYRILTAQGEDAQGGAYSYLAGKNMIGGYAILAYPASWGSSGVMSFICSHDGVVYQSNLGKDTLAVAKQMKRFNPGPGWSKVEEQP